MCLVEATDIV